MSRLVPAATGPGDGVRAPPRTGARGSEISPEKIAPHRHCKECGKPIPLEDTFCSDQCQATFRAKQRRRRNQLYFYYAMMVIILMAALVFLGYR